MQPEAGNSLPFISVFFYLASPFWGMYGELRGGRGIRANGKEQEG
jgi:hypothetical protein